MMRLLTIAIRVHLRVVPMLALAALLTPNVAFAQGVTTGTITGVVIDAQKRPVPGATVVAIHLPSGTTYEGVTRVDGRFSIPNMRIGGPYSVVITPATSGSNAVAFKPVTQENVMVNLGAATDLSFDVQPVVSESVQVVGQSDTVFNTQRTGAATTITREQLAVLPTTGGRLNDITRTTPQSGGTLSFGGLDARLNNITVDGSYFNNSFGLRNSPGDTSGVAPISLSAIEQVQVNIAPYDVRQGNFVGASVNTVTRSGGNTYHGSFGHAFRNESGVGTNARGAVVNPGTFDFRNDSTWASGPIKTNKVFFFVNYDNETISQPATTIRANLGTETVGGNISRVLASDLDQLSTYLQTNFGYETGPYQDYPFNTPANRFLVKSDINLNDHNKLVVRYNQLLSNTDILVSNSSSVGFGTRRGTPTGGLNFANSNYIQLENIHSMVGEWNSIIGTNMANNMIVGYTAQNENRQYTTPTIFPMVDILNAGTVYTTFGFEPFTPKNQLTYNTFQVQNNFQEFAKDHTLTFGVSAERYNALNVFYPASQSVYVYNSLADFYTDANDYLANPNRSTSPITLRRFDLRWNNIPGQDEPKQPLHVMYLGAYVQDEWRAKARLSIVAGLRWDAPYFGATGYDNVNADALTFRDPAGNPVQFNTGALPGSNPLWSPRVGFNWDVDGSHNTQVRGGTGIFTGKPAYVWIANQVGNTGMLTGTERLDNTTQRPWNPDPEHYKPTNVTGAPATSYNLELINHDFKFPQIWRTNIAVDHKLPFGMTGTFEYIYNQDINGFSYYNANLPAAQANYTGADQRPRWTGTSCNAPTIGACSNRINNAAGNVVSTAVVLGNENDGTSWNVAGTLEKRYHAGVWIKGAYSYGSSKNLVDPGSIATGSWTANTIAGDPNNPVVGFSSNSPGHRVFVVGSYNHDFFKFGTSTVSMYWESRTISNLSYTFGADANGDGGTSNDLIYIPRDTSEMYFQQFASGGTTFTPDMQAAAWEAYIKQDPYLSQHRGEYAGRNAFFLPLVHRLDFSASQDVKVKVGGVQHAFQFRVDIDNFTNLLNSNWGVSQRVVNLQPLTDPSVDAQGRLQYRLRVINGALMDHTFERTAGLTDVYRIMFSLRYTF